MERPKGTRKMEKQKRMWASFRGDRFTKNKGWPALLVKNEYPPGEASLYRQEIGSDGSTTNQQRRSVLFPTKPGQLANLWPID